MKTNRIIIFLLAVSLTGGLHAQNNSMETVGQAVDAVGTVIDEAAAIYGAATGGGTESEVLVKILDKLEKIKDMSFGKSENWDQYYELVSLSAQYVDNLDDYYAELQALCNDPEFNSLYDVSSYLYRGEHFIERQYNMLDQIRKAALAIKNGNKSQQDKKEGIEALVNELNAEDAKLAMEKYNLQNARATASAITAINPAFAKKAPGSSSGAKVYQNIQSERYKPLKGDGKSNNPIQYIVITIILLIEAAYTINATKFYMNGDSQAEQYYMRLIVSFVVSLAVITVFVKFI